MTEEVLTVDEARPDCQPKCVSENQDWEARRAIAYLGRLTSCLTTTEGSPGFYSTSPTSPPLLIQPQLIQ
jgi:hypothetical protein